jgi:hypothetical protein
MSRRFTFASGLLLAGLLSSSPAEAGPKIGILYNITNCSGAHQYSPPRVVRSILEGLQAWAGVRVRRPRLTAIRYWPW